MSYKVSVDSVGEGDADDILLALVDNIFRQSSPRGWVLFGLALLMPLSLTTAFWLSGGFLVAATSSAVALALVVCRIIGMSHEAPTGRIERDDATQAQSSAQRRPISSVSTGDSSAGTFAPLQRAPSQAANRTPPDLAIPTRKTVSGKYP